jgi:hypothetical protein
VYTDSRVRQLSTASDQYLTSAFLEVSSVVQYCFLTHVTENGKDYLATTCWINSSDIISVPNGAYFEGSVFALVCAGRLFGRRSRGRRHGGYFTESCRKFCPCLERKWAFKATINCLPHSRTPLYRMVSSAM